MVYNNMKLLRNLPGGLGRTAFTDLPVPKDKVLGMQQFIHFLRRRSSIFKSECVGVLVFTDPAAK